MEATCGKCSFPIHVDQLGVEVTCPACGFRGIAKADGDTISWLAGILGALVVIGAIAAKKEKQHD